MGGAETIRGSRNFLWLMFLMFVSACGNWVEKDEETRILPPIMSQLPPADHYFLADPVCDGTTPTTQLTSATIYNWSPSEQGNFQLTPQKTRLDGFPITSNPFLSSRMVAVTVYGGTYERDCPDSLADQRICSRSGRYVDWEATTPPKPLKICQVDSGFDRESYEGVALTSLHALEPVLSRFQEVYQHPIPRVTLEILPTYISVFENEKATDGSPVRLKTFFTHNLAYFPRKNKISVFPESKDGQQLYSSMGHLWESPFGLAHEAGHHLEQQISERLAESLRVEWSTESHAFKLQTFGPNDPDAEARLAVRNAVSEGFADLAGFYSIDGRQDIVNSLYSIGSNRNPASSYFLVRGEQVPKILSDGVARMLFGLECQECTSQPMFFTAHDVGAILAHAVHRSWEATAEKVALTSDRDRWNAHLAMTVYWLEGTLERLQALQEPADFPFSLFEASATGVKFAINKFLQSHPLTEEQFKALQREVCLIGQQHMPILKDQPYSTGGACE